MTIRSRKFTIQPQSPREESSASSDSILPLRRVFKLGRQSKTSVTKSVVAFGCGALAILFTLSYLQDDLFSRTYVLPDRMSNNSSIVSQHGADEHDMPDRIGDNSTAPQPGGNEQDVPDRIGDDTSISQQVGSEKDTTARIGNKLEHPQGFIAHPSNYPPMEGNYTEFLGFLRISKTASTSVMEFLDGLYSLNSFLRTEIYDTNKKQVYECMYASIQEDTSRSDRNFGDCPHPKYKFLKNQWYKSLPLLDVEPTNTQHRYYYFHPFSMVRDPFDRMVSFFYYVQENIPDWSLSEQQDEKILADDFFGWWKVLVQENMETDFLSFLYMYEAFDDDLDTAIELISGDSPEIMITSSDCVDMSLRLMSTLKPQFFAKERVEDFLHSASNHARARDMSIPKKNFNRTLAREMHKEMFPEDWKFYNAALKQMKRTLMETKKDQFEDDYSTCMGRLDSKIIESGDLFTSS